MKLVLAFVKPPMLNDVVFALHEIEGFPGASISDGRGFGKWRMTEADAAVQREPSNFLPHVRIEIVCEDELAESVARTICDAARTGSARDGVVAVQDVERRISVRTGDEE